MEKDIRFSDKKIDESWKEQAFKERIASGKSQKGAESLKSQPEGQRQGAERSKTSRPFLNLINSLGVQAMIHLGEMPHPETNMTELNLEACRELIDLLIALKEKTYGNWSDEEDYFFSHFLAELQLKFAQKVP